MRGEFEVVHWSPDEVPKNFTCAMFETPQDMLKVSRHLAAVEIGCEPSVKKHVQNIYMNNAVISTCLTAQGNVVIDSYHELTSVKWICDKPLSKFTDSRWLHLQKLPETTQNELLKDAKDNYLSSNTLWNEQREMIIEEAFTKFIFPSMEKEAWAL